MDAKVYRHSTVLAVIVGWEREREGGKERERERERETDKEKVRGERPPTQEQDISYATILLYKQLQDLETHTIAMGNSNVWTKSII